MEGQGAEVVQIVWMGVEMWEMRAGFSPTDEARTARTTPLVGLTMILVGSSDSICYTAKRS